jgi:hypothetical protein
MSGHFHCRFSPGKRCTDRSLLADDLPDLLRRKIEETSWFIADPGGEVAAGRY